MTENEEADVAVKMLLYINSLDYALLELTESLSKEKRYRLHVKKNIKSLQAKCTRVCNIAYMVFGGLDATLCNAHCSRSWEIFKEITDRVYLGGSTKWIAIISSLVRLIEKCNESLSSRFTFLPARELYNAAQYLPATEESSQFIDTIISKINHKIDITQ